MLMRRLKIALAILAIVSSFPEAVRARDAQGIAADGRVVIHRYGTPPPWGRDFVRMVNPTYSPSIGARPPVGGWFRLLLDLPTGTVRRVVVEKSSGYPTVDSTIVRALQQWRLRPNRWREFDVEVMFAPKPPTHSRNASNHTMEPTASPCTICRP